MPSLDKLYQNQKKIKKKTSKKPDGKPNWVLNSGVHSISNQVLLNHKYITQVSPTIRTEKSTRVLSSPKNKNYSFPRNSEFKLYKNKSPPIQDSAKLSQFNTQRKPIPSYLEKYKTNSPVLDIVATKSKKGSRKSSL